MDRSKKYVVFPADYSAPFIMEKAQRYTPSDQDIQDGMQILENHLKNNSAIRDLKEYKIQFFGYISEDKEKILWANCFCDAHGVDWQKNLVFVKDGGNCFLNLKINLDKKEIFDLAINGEA